MTSENKPHTTRSAMPLHDSHVKAFHIRKSANLIRRLVANPLPDTAFDVDDPKNADLLRMMPVAKPEPTSEVAEFLRRLTAANLPDSAFDLTIPANVELHRTLMAGLNVPMSRAANSFSKS